VTRRDGNLYIAQPLAALLIVACASSRRAPSVTCNLYLPSASLAYSGGALCSLRLSGCAVLKRRRALLKDAAISLRCAACYAPGYGLFPPPFAACVVRW